jgi:hypothetical protein
MIDKRLKSEKPQRKLITSAAEHLHLDSSNTRFIKSGSMCSIRCLGGTYKLLKGYPPSPLLVTCLDYFTGVDTRRGVWRFETHSRRRKLVISN